jgi:monovalent cation:H+ antiporter, CPA1 family
MHFEITFVMLFAVATAVALIARWAKIPYTVALVSAGLLLGTTHALQAPHLTKELMFAVFLPGLLFEAAFHLEFRKFWQNKIAIHSLAVPGVAAAILLTALILTPVASGLHFVEGFTFKHGLVFAALLAATDPIAVVAMFKTLGTPKRLGVLIEGESLLNDGTSVVAFTLIVGAITGGPTSFSVAAVNFLTVVGMGTFIGVSIGFAISKVIQQVDDPMIEITLTTIAAYGSFVAAEHFHYSGVIATVCAGMMCGNYAARTGMSPSTRIAVESFWDYVAFALNSIVFLLIGFRVHIETLLASWKAIIVAWLAVTIGRAIIILIATAMLYRTEERIPWKWSAVLTWGGLRGGLSMVLVLSLAPDFPQRELLITMTFGVVVLSILIQGLTMGPLLRKLGIVGGQEDRTTYEICRGSVRAAKAALGELDTLHRTGTVQRDVLERLREEYSTYLANSEEELRELHIQASAVAEEEIHAVRRQLLQIEKDTVNHDYRKGMLSQEAYDDLMVEVDARLFRLEQSDMMATTQGEDPEKTNQHPNLPAVYAKHQDAPTQPPPKDSPPPPPQQPI